MELNYKNGKLSEERGSFIIDNDTIDTLIIDNKAVPFEKLPKLFTSQDLDLRYLNYGSKTFVIVKDYAQKLEHFFMYEQKITNDKLEVIGFNYSLLISSNNILEPLLNVKEQNTDFVLKTVRLLYYYLSYIDYAVNHHAVYNQIMAFLAGESEQKSEKIDKEETEEKKTLAQMARDAGLSYKTLWSRVNVRGIPLERALEKDKPREKVSKKNKYPDVTFEGKNLRELAEEYGIKYNKLWDRVHRQGRTIEEALAMGNKKRK